MAWLSGAWTVTSLLVVAIRPPYMSPWLAADGQSTMFSRWIGVEATGLAVEVALWALAIHLVMSLQMQRNRCIFIIAAFGFRLLKVLPILICINSLLTALQDISNCHDASLLPCPK